MKPRSWADLFHKQNNNSKDRQEFVENLIANAVMSRSNFLKQFTDPRRDIDDECGYPKGQITAAMCQELFDRDPIAARVVEVLAQEAWKVQPNIYEIEDARKTTPFEKAWRDLSRQLQGDENYYQDEDGSCIWEVLRRADELSGIGRYGVILLGLDDISDSDSMRIPARSGKGRKLLYLRVFPETLATISQLETRRSSPRFGQPLTYTISFSDIEHGEVVGGSYATMSEEVHWSRVIHLTDNMLSSEIFGIPRMQPVYNRLMDLSKLYGGSAEMYWRGAFPGMSFETHPSLGPDFDLLPSDAQAVKDSYEDYANGLQRALFLTNVTAKSLAPQVVDPTNQIDVQIEAICIKLGIPKRIFMGSERGQLASTQDVRSWNERLRFRQRYYLTPRVIVPFVNRLIKLGVLPTPEVQKVDTGLGVVIKQGYSVWWPDLNTQTEEQRASVAFQRTQALAQYAGSRSDRYVSPMDYLVRFLHFNEVEANSIIENVKAYLETLKPEPLPETKSVGGKNITETDTESY